jgi:antitoxin Phd
LLANIPQSDQMRMLVIMRTWQLQEAKSRFSEVVDLTLKEGPQLVTRRGEEVVVILSVNEYRCLSGKNTNLMDCLLNAPRGEPLVHDRSREPTRDLGL